MFRLPRGWDFRGRFALIGRDTEVGKDYSFDQRIQFLIRYPLIDFRGGDLEVRGGTFYERHFRGDSVDDFNVYRQAKAEASSARARSGCQRPSLSGRSRRARIRFNPSSSR